LCYDEFIHTITCHEDRGRRRHVSKLGSALKPTNKIPRMSGGALMVALGIAYLLFEKTLLAKSKLPGDSSASADDTLSRSLIGIQVGLAKTTRKSLLNTNRSALSFWP
jgi:hypothetical protein